MTTVPKTPRTTFLCGSTVSAEFAANASKPINAKKTVAAAVEIPPKPKGPHEIAQDKKVYNLLI